jgi:hypothetical protein
MKGSPVKIPAGGNAYLLNAMVEAIDMIWSRMAMRGVDDTRPMKRG